MRKFSYLLLLLFLLPPFYTRAADILLEAENATLTGVEVATAQTGFSGTGYVTGFDLDGDRLSWTFTAPAGLHELIIGYSTPYGPKGFSVQVNTDRNDGMFAEIPTFTTMSAGKYNLVAGSNTISILKNWGWFLIDYVKLVPAALNPPITPTPTLIDTKATASTKALYNYLRSIYGTKTLSGQQDDINYILNVTGKEPAIAAYDLIEYSPSRVQNSSYPTGMSERFLSYAQKGNNRGMVTLCWHWNAPTDLINEAPDKLWWSGFYTRATTFDIQAVLADTTSERYQLILRDIDAIAVELKKFQAADVPVLWRPLHEAAGGWFWWGAKGAEPFKALWKILYNRLTHHHNLHNLIWVFTTDAQANWYPGDNYVDILSLDIYADPTSSLSVQWEETQNLLRTLNAKKMVALSETGNLPDPEKMRTFGIKWAWFANWTGSYITNQPTDYVKRVFNDVDVITLDELPNWRGSTTDPNTPPSITVTADKPSYTAPATILLTANAADTDGTVSKVEFYNGTTLLGSDLTAPFTFSWANVASGTYALTAKATDDKGASTTSTAVSVVVAPTTTNRPPTVSLTTNQATYVAPATVVVSATAADSDGTISKVEFYNGNTLLASDATAPYTYTWTNVASGTYSLSAKAYDNQAAVTTSTAVSVVVTPSSTNTPPTVSLSTNQPTYTAPASVVLSATASDADGTISKVEFYNGSTLLASDATAPYTYTWANVASGTYSLTAKAYDNLAAVTTSAAKSITVTGVNGGGDIIGPDCGTANQSGTFELSAANKAGATRYSWWFTGSSQSVTPSGDGSKVTIQYNSYLSGGKVYVGVNYSGPPYYKEFSKTITVCPAGARVAIGEGAEKSSLRISPNPAKDVIWIAADQPIAEVRLVNSVGKQVYRKQAIAASSAQVAVHSLAQGIYQVVIIYANGVRESRSVYIEK